VATAATNTAFRGIAFAPTASTAAGVSVSGRVLNSFGAGIRNARVIMRDQAGNVRTTYSNAFGSYSFADVQVGEAYIFGVQARGYSFGEQVVQVFDTLTSVDFMPNQ
ncbi:MAG TPA: carboxypeptidase-like regulatory domain-containing protein, partial [Pyrinomonadaceae bacterium]|nr:carboxypeptidase-like regulatory domain-containing protein [Pyrinomonadaceae bacterium]